MVYPWFHKTQLDERFYDEHLRDRMPPKLLDAHVHMNLQEHVQDVPPERIREDWALETGLHMDLPASREYYSALFPGVPVELNAFPFPLPEVDIEANNEYLGQLADEGAIRAMMSVRPQWTAEICEWALTGHRFAGFKPYPYLASQEKGADISIYDFMPRHQLEVLNRHRLSMMLHLPRHGRLPDPDNIRELREIRQDYPDIRIILAHFGRCFEGRTFQKAMEALGQDRGGFFFDCAAVTNFEVFVMALEQLDSSRILYGSDLPIMLWHGEQDWNEAGSAVNFTREDFSWNKSRKSPEEEAGYTFIAYRQMNNLLDALGSDRTAKERIFYANADALLRGGRHA